MRKLSLRILRTEDDLHSFFPSWEELLSKVSNTILYVEPAWIGLWWKHLSKERKLHVLCFFDEEKVVGICPLMSEGKRAATKLFFIGAPLSGNMDFIIDPDYREDVFRVLLEYIRDKSNPILFNLQGFPEDSLNYKYLEETLKRHRVPFYVSKVRNYVVKMESKDFDTYYRKRFSKKTIKALDRKEERLHNIAQAEFRKGERLQGIAPLEFREGGREDMASAFALHDLRLQRKAIQSSFSKGTARDFFMEICDLQHAAFKPRLYFLTLGGADISFIYLFQYKNQLLLKRIGHDDTFRLFNPGSILLRSVIKECFASGQELISFGTGEDEYKKIWTDDYYYVKTISFSSDHPAAHRSWSIKRALYSCRDKVRSRRNLLLALRKFQGQVKYAVRHKRAAYGRKSVQQYLQALIKKVYSAHRMMVLEKRPKTLKGNPKGGHPPTMEDARLPDQGTYSFRYFALGDLAELSAHMNCQPEAIIKRLDKQFRCCLILAEEKIVYCAWINCHDIIVPEISFKKNISSGSVFLSETFPPSGDQGSADIMKAQMEDFLYQMGFRRIYYTVCLKMHAPCPGINSSCPGLNFPESNGEKVKYSFTVTTIFGKTKSIRTV